MSDPRVAVSEPLLHGRESVIGLPRRFFSGSKALIILSFFFGSAVLRIAHEHIRDVHGSAEPERLASTAWSASPRVPRAVPAVSWAAATLGLNTNHLRLSGVRCPAFLCQAESEDSKSSDAGSSDASSEGGRLSRFGLRGGGRGSGLDRLDRGLFDRGGRGLGGGRGDFGRGGGRGDFGRGRGDFGSGRGDFGGRGSFGLGRGRGRGDFDGQGRGTFSSRGGGRGSSSLFSRGGGRPFGDRSSFLDKKPSFSEPGFFTDKSAPGFRQAPVPKRGDRSPQMVMNYEIEATEVRVMDQDKVALGIMPKDEALEKAQEEQKDLILINANAQPPVCRIIEYSKFKFEKEKADKEGKKKMRESKVEIKELKLRNNIDVHDYDVKLRQCLQFLSKGDKAKVLVPLRKMEMIKGEGRPLLERFINDVGDQGVVEAPPRLFGNKYTIIIAPSLKAKAAGKADSEAKKKVEEKSPALAEVESTGDKTEALGTSPFAALASEGSDSSSLEEDTASVEDGVTEGAGLTSEVK